MISKPLIRPARRADALTAASLIRLTMGATADLFMDAKNGGSPADLLAALFARDGSRFSYRYGSVLDVDGQVAGLLMSYPASKMTVLDLITGRDLLFELGLREMLRLTRRLLPKTGIREAERGEYYISNVGVLPQHQGHGYGTLLMNFAEKLTRTSGLRKCSLTVDEYNDGAIRLYQRLGYRIVNSGKYKDGGTGGAHAGFHHMIKDLV